MSDKIDVHQVLKTEIRPQADKLLKAHKPQTEKLKGVLLSIDPDIEEKNIRMLRLHAKAIQAMTTELGEDLGATKTLLEQLAELEEQGDLMKNLDEFEKLTADLEGLEDKITKNFEIAKQTQDKANDAIEAYEKSEGDADDVAADWAKAERLFEGYLELGKKRLEETEKVQARAEKAVASRDAKALAEAQKASETLANHAKPENVTKTFENYCNQVNPKNLNKDQQDQFARDKQRYEKIVDEYIALAAKIIAMDVKIQAMEIEVAKQVDVKKATAVLKVPSTSEAKLKKAFELEGSALLKALDAIGKDLKPKTTGKDMVAALKKAKLM